MAQSPSTQSDDNTVRRDRIISHMNASHRDSLSLFLQHYCRVPSSSSSVSLATLNLDCLILTCGGKRYYVPLHPPLSSLSEIRPRMKSMHADCLHALDLSAAKLTAYVPPQGFFQTLNFFLCAVTMLSFSRRTHFTQGSFFYSTLCLSSVPNFAGFCWRIQPLLIAIMIPVHAAEAVQMARTRLRRHGVRKGSEVWWLWLGSCFIEGVTSFWRIDALIDGVKRERERTESEGERKEIDRKRDP
jgi:Protein of unknown function (DUF2470)